MGLFLCRVRLSPPPVPMQWVCSCIQWVRSQCSGFVPLFSGSVPLYTESVSLYGGSFRLSLFAYTLSLFVHTASLFVYVVGLFVFAVGLFACFGSARLYRYSGWFACTVDLFDNHRICTPEDTQCVCSPNSVYNEYVRLYNGSVPAVLWRTPIMIHKPG